MAMNCRSASRLIDRVVDGVATEHERNLLRFHINGCPECRRRLELTRDISRVMKTISSPHPPADLESSVRRMLETGTDIGSDPAAAGGGLRQRFLLGLPFAAAAAAVFLAVSTLIPADSPVSEARSASVAVSGAEHRKLPGDFSTAPSKVSSEEVSLAPLAPYQRSANIVSF